jgi:hypothetical protein
MERTRTPRSNLPVDHLRTLTVATRAGSGVVLDFSFWPRRMQDEYRDFLSLWRF